MARACGLRLLLTLIVAFLMPLLQYLYFLLLDIIFQSFTDILFFSLVKDGFSIVGIVNNDTQTSKAATWDHLDCFLNKFVPVPLNK